MNEDKQNRFLLLLLAFFALLAILFSAGNFKLEEIIRVEDARVEKIAQELADLELEAKAVQAYDLSENKKLFGVNDNVALPIASLAKTMTVTLALNTLGEEKIVYISPAAVKQSGDYGLKIGETWRSGELAKFTLLASANDGAYALAEGGGLGTEEFLKKMNEKAKKIGMENTVFLNVTGLDKMENDLPVAAGGFASASDLNILAYYALRDHPEIFRAAILPELNGFKNTNPIVGEIPNLLFSKTGFTDLAGGNLTVIFRDKNNHLIAITLLGSTYEGRFSDMEKIVEILYNSSITSPY